MSDQHLLQKADFYFRAGLFEQAEEIYTRLLQKLPDDGFIIYRLGKIFQDQGKLADAEQAFRHIINLNLNMPMVYYNLGSVLCEQGKLEASFTMYRRYAELTYQAPRIEDTQAHPSPRHRHDKEQYNFLYNANLLNKSVPELNFHIEDCERLIRSAVNPDLNITEVNINDKGGSIYVVDNLLTEEAVIKLRHFCLNSTIWRQTYSAGYLGAMPEHGMGSPLLAQITEELRVAFPAIISTHPLLHFWAFKYDHALKGTAVHADYAAVNVNFWITPDESNLNPEHGGLVIWDTPAPTEWDFFRYNGDIAGVQKFLEKTGAKSTRVPYRCNRAVIFKSNLFHETDICTFKTGYTNRRINITLLYGERY